MTNATCNTTTGEIFGCKPLSRQWWHEKGHIEFSKSPKGNSLHQFQDFLMKLYLVLLLGAVINKLFVFVAGLIILIYFGIDLYEENKCWEYADAMGNTE